MADSLAGRHATVGLRLALHVLLKRTVKSGNCRVFPLVIVLGGELSVNAPAEITLL